MGYVLRVSEANGYETPWHLLRLAGFEQGEMNGAGFPVAKLAGILGRSPESLEGIAYKQEGEGPVFKILGHELGHSLSAAPLRIAESALCPHCVEKSGHIDAFWDLRSAVACPTHGCRVLRTCPCCGKALAWFRPGLLTCRCGASLANISLPTVERPLVELMGIIKARLEGQPLSLLLNSAGFPLNHLEGITLSALLWLLDKLGHLNIESKGLPPVGIGEAVEAAVEPLANWPTGYHQFLTRLGHRYLADTPAVAGLRKQFEAFYSVLFKNSHHAAASVFLREEFVAFGLNTWGNGIVDKKLLRDAQPAIGRFVSKTAFAKQHGIWKPCMDRMIADGTIVTTVIPAGKATRTQVDLKLTRIPAQSAGVVTLREAAKHLGIPVSVLEGLRATGVFETKARAGRASTWHVDDVEAFLARGLTLAKLAEAIDTKASVALRDVMRVKLRDADAKTDIVAALFDGRVPVVGHHGQNLSGLLVQKADLDEFILDKRRRVEMDSFSLPDVAKMTGLDLMVVASAIKQGLLDAVDRDGRRRVPAESVDTFNAEYVVLQAVAMAQGTDARPLASLARKAGITVIDLLRPTGVSQPILQRSSEAALIAVWQKEQERRVTLIGRDEQMAERRRDYESALCQYLENLRLVGDKLPRRGGRPNKVAIARSCGFERDVLYSYPSVIAILEAYDQREHSQSGGDCLTVEEKVLAYIDSLTAESKPLPRLANRQLNKLAIAKDCGIHRNVLYNRPELMAALERHPL